MKIEWHVRTEDIPFQGITAMTMIFSTREEAQLYSDNVSRRRGGKRVGNHAGQPVEVESAAPLPAKEIHLVGRNGWRRGFPFERPSR